MSNKLDPSHGEQITPHLRMGESFYIEDDDGTRKKYKLIEGKQLDKKTFKPLAVVKPVAG